MSKHKYLGPAAVFTHDGKDYHPGDTFEIDDKTIEVMVRHGHVFEDYVKAGVPLLGYDLTDREPTAATIGNAPGAGAAADAAKAEKAAAEKEKPANGG